MNHSQIDPALCVLTYYPTSEGEGILCIRDDDEAGFCYEPIGRVSSPLKLMEVLSMPSFRKGYLKIHSMNDNDVAAYVHASDVCGILKHI